MRSKLGSPFLRMLNTLIYQEDAVSEPGPTHEISHLKTALKREASAYRIRRR